MSSMTANYYSLRDPNYRRFELPWTSSKEETDRLRKILYIVIGVLALFSVAVPFLPVPELERNVEVEIPPRLAKLVIEKKAVPPPPPPVVEDIPEEVKPEPKPKPVEPPPKPVVIPPPPKPIETVAKIIEPPPIIPPEQSREEVIEQAREKAKTVGLLAVADDLQSLRDNSAVTNTSGQNLSTAVETSDRTERSLITSKSSTRSAGVNTSSLSRNTGGGGLAGRNTTVVSAPVSTSSSSSSSNNSGVSGSASSASGGGYAGQRSQEEIETVFDKNKAAIYALYRRALRKDPTLQGKLVLELTIASSGKVVSCAIISSELNSSEFEQALIRRVKLFDFGAQDVDQITTTKPIDFFPA